MTITDFLLARIAEDEERASLVLLQSVDTSSGVPQIRETSIRDRVLAECAAKRRIVELHDQGLKAALRNGDASAFGGEVMHDLVLCTLASVYADHPDFDPEWSDTPTR